MPSNKKTLSVCSISTLGLCKQPFAPVWSLKKHAAYSPRQDPYHSLSDHPGWRDLHACGLDDRIAGVDAVQADLCKLQPVIYYTDYSEETKTLEELFTDMGGDPSNSDSCIRYGTWENYGDVDDRFHDLSKKEKRYKFVCVDTDKNDCLSFAELTTLVDVGLGGAGEAKIESLALATDDELSDNGYTGSDRLCAGHLLAYD